MPICSTNTAANRTVAPCRTKNSSVSFILVPGRPAADQSGSDDMHHSLYPTHSLPFITPPSWNLKMGFAGSHQIGLCSRDPAGGPVVSAHGSVLNRHVERPCAG